MSDKVKREPLFHITKRGEMPWHFSLSVRAIAIELALAACALICVVFTGSNPLEFFSTIFSGAFGSSRKMWVTFQNVAILLSLSLAVTPAFKMRFWNIGAEGQTLIGCLASAACMITLRDVLPGWLLLIVMLLASVLAGAIWGGIPAFFKAMWNTNETLFTLMMNYVATQLVAFFCIVWESPKGSGKIGVINPETEIGWLPVIGGQKYLLSILAVRVPVLHQARL